MLTANIQNVIASGNAGNGLLVDVQGNDKNDPNQPMVGTVNTLTWNNNQFNGNGANGALFRTRGDSMFLADGESNQMNGNSLNGVLVETSENSSFGDATDGLPPGQRVLWNGFSASNNVQGMAFTSRPLKFSSTHRVNQQPNSIVFWCSRGPQHQRRLKLLQ